MNEEKFHALSETARVQTISGVPLFYSVFTKRFHLHDALSSPP